MTSTEPTMVLSEGEGGKPVVKVFVCLAAVDQDFAGKFSDAYFTGLGTVPNYSFDRWWMYELLVGERVDDQIRTHIAEAHLGVVLISPSLLNSPYVQGMELPRLLDQDNRRIIPVMLRDVPRRADYLGINAHQIYGYGNPFRATAGHARDLWVNALVDQTVAILDRYGRRIAR